MLASVGLADKQDELASALSHGEQRNLEIGIALATEPKLLCLDEPTAGMSVTETHATVELIRRISADLTILIVEHDMEVVMGLARTITVLHYGEVLAEGTPGRDPGQRPRAGGLSQDLMLTLDGRPHVLRQVAHPPRRVARGARRERWLGLLGRNGVGKSTTLKTIMGLVHPASSGRIVFEGRDIAGLPPYRLARLGIACVPEDRRIFRLLSVMENLRTGLDRPEVTARPPAGAPRQGLHELPDPDASGATRRAARCPAASSRCWRSRAR